MVQIEAKFTAAERLNLAGKVRKMKNVIADESTVSEVPISTIGQQNMIGKGNIMRRSPLSNNSPRPPANY